MGAWSIKQDVCTGTGILSSFWADGTLPTMLMASMTSEGKNLTACDNDKCSATTLDVAGCNVTDGCVNACDKLCVMHAIIANASQHFVA